MCLCCVDACVCRACFEIVCNGASWSSRWFVRGIEIRTSSLGEAEETFCNDGLLNTQGEQLQGTPPNECVILPLASWRCHPCYPPPWNNPELLLAFQWTVNIHLCQIKKPPAHHILSLAITERHTKKCMYKFMRWFLNQCNHHLLSTFCPEN